MVVVVLLLLLLLRFLLLLVPVLVLVPLVVSAEVVAKVVPKPVFVLQGLHILASPPRNQGENLRPGILYQGPYSKNRATQDSVLGSHIRKTATDATLVLLLSVLGLA